MARYGLLFPWKCFRVLQICIIATTLNSVVLFTQFFTSISPYYVKTYAHLSYQDTGLYMGLILGGYFLGRGLTHRMWVSAANTFGFRPIFMLVGAIETILTFICGASLNVYLTIACRILMGVFSAISPLTTLVIKRLSADFGEDLSLVVTALSIVSTLGMIFGYLLSGCMTSTAESDLTEGSAFREFPYLFPLLLNACILSLSLFCLCVEFPDLRPISDPPRKKPLHGLPSSQQAFGKYAELSETITAQTDPQRIDSSPCQIPTAQENPATNQENPITERKEAEAEEDDLPGYLQCFELGDIQVEESGRGSGAKSNRSAIAESPVYSSRSNKADKTMTERKRVVAVIQTSQKEDNDTVSHIPKPDYDPCPNLKKTCVSFMEEDFRKMSGSSLHLSLDDPYKREPGHSLSPYYLACAVLCLSNMCSSWLEGGLVIWMLVRTPGVDISMELMGVILAGSIAGVWLSMFAFSYSSYRFILHRTSLTHSFLLLLTIVGAALLPWTGVKGVFWVLCLLALMFLVRYFTSFICSFAALMVSDSVDIDSRALAVMNAETWATLFKGLGFIGGPLLFSIGEHQAWSHFEPSLLVAGVLVLIGATITALSESHFPRFQHYPYEM